MRTELYDLRDFHLPHVSRGFTLFLPTVSLTNMGSRDRLFGFTASLSENRIPSAHLMIEDKDLFGLEVLFQPVLHVLNIGPGDDGGIFEIFIGIREFLLHNFESMCVQGELRLYATNVGNADVFHIFVFHIGLSSARDVIDRNVHRERLLS